MSDHCHDNNQRKNKLQSRGHNRSIVTKILSNGQKTSLMSLLRNDSRDITFLTLPYKR